MVSILMGFTRFQVVFAISLTLGREVQGRFFPLSGVVTHEPPVAKTPPNVTLPDSLAKAQELIRDIELQPTCKRIALKEMTSLCATYDGRNNPEDTDETTNRLVAIFALRLVNCELIEARQSMPQTCMPFLQPQLPHIDTVQRNYVSECLEDLYHLDSNAYQTFQTLKLNSHFMCYAMRSERDKEEGHRFYEILFKAVKQFGGTLNEQASKMDDLLPRFEGLRKDMRSLYADLQIENREAKAAIRHTFDEIKSNADYAQQQLSALAKDAGIAVKHFEKRENEIRGLMEHIASLGTDVDSWTTGVSRFRDEYEDWITKVRFNVELIFSDLAQNAYAVSNSVDFVNREMGQLVNQFEKANSDLVAPLEKLGDLNSGMDDLLIKHQQMHGDVFDMHEQVNLTRESVHETHSKLQAISSVLEGIATAVTWVKTFETSVIFFGVWLVVSCPVWFGIWQMLGLGVVGAFTTAVGCSFGLSIVLTYAVSPIDFFRSLIVGHPRICSNLSTYASFAFTASLGVFTGMWIMYALQFVQQNREQSAKRIAIHHSLADSLAMYSDDKKAHHTIAKNYDPEDAFELRC